MTSPQFGNCKDCAAWVEPGAQGRSGRCTRSKPYADGLYCAGDDGCWSFIPRVVKSCETCARTGTEELCGECWRGSIVYGDYWTPKKETE